MSFINYNMSLSRTRESSGVLVRPNDLWISIFVGMVVDGRGTRPTVTWIIARNLSHCLLLGSLVCVMVFEKLVMSERFDWIKPGSFDCREHAENHACASTETHR